MATAVFFGLILLACIGIMYSCNVFEPAADHLGRNMKEGVKGATINAIGSSLPELFTTLILLFLYKDMDGLSGGVATTAGSAVFNAVLIPGGAILAVTMVAKLTTSIEVSRKVLLRDGFFVLFAEIVLIYFLGFSELTWWMGATLMGIYAVYFAVLMKMGGGGNDEDDGDDEEIEDDLVSQGIVRDFLTAMKGDDIPLTDGVAWLFLSVSVVMVGAFCLLLSEATVGLAQVWDVPLFVTTVVFAAAATSVPDTILSVKDALKGNYDDAIANAIGSNIFDVCMSLGLPLTLYCLVTGGPVALHLESSDSNVQILRVVMLGFTALVIGMFSVGAVGKKTGLTLIGLYVAWLCSIAYTLSVG